MSDYDDDMLYESEIEDNFGDDAEDDPEVRAENFYFEAKDIALSNLKESIAKFEEVLQIEPSQGIWGFKSLKRMIKIYHTIGQPDLVFLNYKRLLQDYSSMLLDNEKSINSLLEFIDGTPNIKEICDLTFNKLEEKGNKKAVLRLELRLAKVLYDNKDFNSLSQKLNDMHNECKLSDGSDDPTKSNQLMEIYALEILMYTSLGNISRLKESHEKALQIKGLCNPRVSGIIHECGAKIHMREHHWTEANTDFFEAFKNYDDAGIRDKSCQCLKYLVFANMLSGSDINPFHEPRARSYQNNEEIESMISLVEAYQTKDIKKFEYELKKGQTIIEDPFIAQFLSELINNLRSKVIIGQIKPYTNIGLDFIANELNIDVKEVEYLLCQLILDGKINGKMDQFEKVLRLSHTDSSHLCHIKALDKLARNLESLSKAAIQKLI